ncbi:MAG: maleylpyruvate isomerase family mycothiol-dependent enzyme [Acidimicrobiia bacterium]|nr:maleylpyruvate isomerase family mycothiol-dependent enzyme [Acidimicrobiia bacterium]
MADRAVVAELEETWRSLLALGGELDEADWDRATDCPGWTVRDQYSHVVGTECSFLARGARAGDEAFGPHVHNEIGQFNEREVRSRQGRSGAEILAELTEVSALRLEALRAMGDEDFTTDSWTPAGPGTYEGFMRIRVFDGWVHEQDVRRAVDRPGHLSGAAAERSLDQVVSATPFIVGKRAGAPDGATVTFSVTGPVDRTWAVGVEGRRARPLDDVPESPTATLTTDFATFMVLACGRRDPAAALEDGRVQVGGDASLGRAVATNLAFTI